MPPQSSSTSEDVRQRVLEILLSHSDAELTLEAVRDDLPLLKEGLGLDSIDLLDALVEIEQAVNLRLREEDLTEEVLATVGGFADHVCRRIAALRT